MDGTDLRTSSVCFVTDGGMSTFTFSHRHLPRSEDVNHGKDQGVYTSRVRWLTGGPHRLALAFGACPLNLCMLFSYKLLSFVVERLTYSLIYNTKINHVVSPTLIFYSNNVVMFGS